MAAVVLGFIFIPSNFANMNTSYGKSFPKKCMFPIKLSDNLDTFGKSLMCHGMCNIR